MGFIPDSYIRFKFFNIQKSIIFIFIKQRNNTKKLKIFYLIFC